jgi:hypothetical protein
MVPGVTLTVSRVAPVGATELGLAAPEPDGFVEPPAERPSMDTLSIANAWAFVVVLPELTE